MKHLPHLVTFPRSGSHYFQDIIYKDTKINIEMSHSVTSIFDKDNNKQKTLITIVRDPVDSISSYLALQEVKYGPTNLPRLEQTLTEYVLMYSFLYDHADYVIDFKDLVESPDHVAKTVLKLLNINKKDYHLFTRSYNIRHSDYVESSKTLAGYKKLMLEEFNIELCYFYYNRLLSKKIVI
jgi:hypothetical protein